MPLSKDEMALAEEAGIAQDVCAAVKDHSGSPLERAVEMDQRGKTTPAAGVSVAVKDGKHTERLMDALRPALAGRGYRAFWSARHKPNGMKETDEVVVLKTDDPFAMIRLRHTDGSNYGVSMDDIINRLRAWMEVCSLKVVGASEDWVAVVFSKLPEKICAFAEEVYLFCPDSVVQEIGLLREREDPEKFAAARRLCPDISPAIARRDAEPLPAFGSLDPKVNPRAHELMEKLRKNSTPISMGVRLLAHELARTKYLFLWWD
jgi:hypothetical protein